MIKEPTRRYDPCKVKEKTAKMEAGNRGGVNTFEIQTKAGYRYRRTGTNEVKNGNTETQEKIADKKMESLKAQYQSIK